MMRLAITGAGGMLGQDVRRAGERAGHDVVALDREALDVTDRDAVLRVIGDARPDAVVNCAAYTRVDDAEADEATAHALNADAAGHVAEAAAAAGATIVYPSTDYVFDGTTTEPYVESDPVAPQSAYGRTKLAGERATAAANPRHVVARTAWLFGTGGGNFVETMLTIGARDGRVRVVDDQVGSPTWTGHLATALLALAAGDRPGVHHVTAEGSCSWFAFAEAIFAGAGAQVEVEPVGTDAFPRPAPRPAYSVLATAWQDAEALPDWRAGLDAYLEVRS